LFLIQKGNDGDALKMISNVYKCESEEQKQEILTQLKSTMAVEPKAGEGDEEPDDPSLK